MKFNKVHLIRTGYFFFAAALFYLLYLAVSSNAQVDDEHRLALPIVWFNSSGSEPDPPTENETPTPIETLMSTATPTDPSPPTIDPMVTATPTVDPLLTAEPTATHDLGQIVFESPEIIETLQVEANLTVNWSGCEQATSFRLVYGTLGARPESVETTERSVTLGPLGNGSYRLWVECYDRMGNSAFTPPVTVEVS
ncbi:MAG: hypothetical protein AAF633_07895 [Chloroflexota bacterium]